MATVVSGLGRAATTWRDLSHRKRRRNSGNLGLGSLQFARQAVDLSLQSVDLSLLLGFGGVELRFLGVEHGLRLGANLLA
jgi:hypothetical protein